MVTADNGIRTDTSLEALARLRPVFDRRHGSVTAGNSSPLTDGASALVLMDGDGRRPRAWSRWATSAPGRGAAVDPAGQLLQGPAYAAPLALDRAGLTMKDIGLMEMHEAFAAQVLSNLQALDSADFARDASWAGARRSGIPTPTSSTSWGAPSPSAIPSAPRADGSP